MRIQGRYIYDEKGRTMILRGCNLGGSSKQPAGKPGAGLLPESLENPAGASFTGRPFPLEEAEAHFERLARRGFTFLRLVVTWEALEHAGPGIYDEAYLAYLRKILLAAETKGIRVFIDPHQDAWSRWTGGDGAPAWTLEKFGMDTGKLDRTGAAVTWQHGARRRMIWPSNYNRYAAATLFTLFFGGNTYAPDVTVEGKSAQDWLQEHYIAAWRHCYRRLKNCAAVAGWGVMNEPHQGFIGHRDAGKSENPMMPVGAMPSPFDAMLAASGHSVKVPVRPGGHEILNPEGISLFRDGFSCPWKEAGVWTPEGGGRLLRKEHFAFYRGRPANFTEDFLKPFMIRFIETMKEPNPAALFFIEGPPPGIHPVWGPGDPPNTVNAFHHYDGFTLYAKTFIPWFNLKTEKFGVLLGRKKTAAYFSRTLEKSVDWTRERMQDMPSLLGEFGLPFDLNGRKAFRTGDYRVHEDALSLYYDGVDANLLHSTIWNYTADNTNETGDNWNGEDLSIFSEGKIRAEGGWVRPYPMATAGIPVRFCWDRKKLLFSFRFRASAEITAPTEIFLPGLYFGDNPSITMLTSPGPAETGPRFEYRPEEQRLFIWNEGRSGDTDICVKAKA
ncbi:MAG: cellulase family glycosylhydrolase [Treponema sp.]|jgi:hypothetical protein|nr:cellulase family glycosylhydrolase [Treponema sp.]